MTLTKGMAIRNHTQGSRYQGQTAVAWFTVMFISFNAETGRPTFRAGAAAARLRRLLRSRIESGAIRASRHALAHAPEPARGARWTAAREWVAAPQAQSIRRCPRHAGSPAADARSHSGTASGTRSRSTRLPPRARAPPDRG